MCTKWWNSILSCLSAFLIKFVFGLQKDGDEESDDDDNEAGSKQLAFVRVYVGMTTMCLVHFTSLQTAHVEKTNGKKTLIFRLAAKNAKGYGSAIQVRWIQGMRHEQCQLCFLFMFEEGMTSPFFQFNSMKQQGFSLKFLECYQVQ